jgi:hypothetical protein
LDKITHGLNLVRLNEMPMHTQHFG